MPGEDLLKLAGGDVPNARGPVVGCGGEQGAVGGERDVPHRVAMSGEDVPQLAGGHVPDARGAVGGGGGE